MSDTHEESGTNDWKIARECKSQCRPQPWSGCVTARRGPGLGRERAMLAPGEHPWPRSKRCDAQEPGAYDRRSEGRSRRRQNETRQGDSTDVGTRTVIVKKRCAKPEYGGYGRVPVTDEINCATWYSGAVVAVCEMRCIHWTCVQKSKIGSIDERSR